MVPTEVMRGSNFEAYFESFPGTTHTHTHTHNCFIYIGYFFHFSMDFPFNVSPFNSSFAYMHQEHGLFKCHAQYILNVFLLPTVFSYLYMIQNIKGTASLCNKLVSEKKSLKNYNTHENCDCIWLYLSRNNMIRIPEIGSYFKITCYKVILSL